MRHLPSVARASVFGFVLAAVSAPALSSNLQLTVDLLAPSTACTTGGCPSDFAVPGIADLPVSATSFSFDFTDTYGLTEVALDNALTRPIVCDELSGTGPSYTFGATGGSRFSPSFTNSTPGGLLDFNGGGSTVIDASLVYVGTVASMQRSNTPTSQAGCYSINPLGDATPALASGTLDGDRIFTDVFDVTHFPTEPWVSVNTVLSPTGSTGSLGLVMQIHNANKAVNWHLVPGYDHALFSAQSSNNNTTGQWCVLSGGSSPQPGPVIVQFGATCGAVGNNYVVSAADIQTATNSVYLSFQYKGSSVITSGSTWASLPTSFYPASVALFPPPGVYVQRFDDKVAVAGANNLPVLNVGNISCANDASSTPCTVQDPDGNAIPSSVLFSNTKSGAAVAIDPLAYFVDPNNATTVPGNTSADAISVSGISCDDPNGIFASPVTSSNFVASTSLGAKALHFSFKPSGALFVPGTAVCTATLTAAGFTPALSVVRSFTVTMQQTTVTQFLVSAPASATAGAPFNYTVTAQDGSGNTVETYTGLVNFSSSDTSAVLPNNAPLTNGVGTFSATLKDASPNTIKATDASSSSVMGVSNPINVSAGAATHLKVSVPPSVTAGMAFNFAVTALDAFNNTADGYAGMVSFTSTDGSATLPAGSIGLTFGVGSASATLRTTTALQTISASDGSISGTSTSITVAPPP